MTKQVKIIVGVLVGMTLLTILYTVLKSDSKEDDIVESFENTLNEDKFSYEDLLREEKGNEFLVDDYYDLNSNNEDTNEQVTEDDIYANEFDDIALKHQEQILENNAQRLTEEQLKQPTINNKPYENKTYDKPIEKKSELTEEEKELAYIERLEADRKSAIDLTSRNKKEIQVIAEVYGDQDVVNNSRLEFYLIEPLYYKGKTFPKGTPVFAYFTINGSRIVLDIQNISGTNMNVTAYDFYDDRLGMFSESAGIYWEEFKESQKDNVQEETAGVVQQQTNSSLVGSAVRDFGSFLKSLRSKKRESVFIVNGDKVKFKIK